MKTRKIAVTLAALATVTLSATACSTEDDTTATPSNSQSPSQTMTDEPMEMQLVGPGCADYAEQVPDGAGSVEGMAKDPVAVAASNNPLLKTLTAAVSGGVNPDVDLVDTLNGDEFTVFAPVDSAFAKLDKATLDTLSKDADLLTDILTYHVVPGQLSPDEVVGEQTAVNGDVVEVAGQGNKLTVNGANVICGGVTTANATVYLIDGVLTPPTN